MRGDLIINGKDAFNTWGVDMGEGFLNSLLTPPPVKDYIENKSRLENGKRVILDNKKDDERDFNLIFTIKGSNQSDYVSKLKAFMTEVSSGSVSINVPAIGNEVYHVYYKNSISFAFSLDRTFSKIAMKVCEPNPSDRG